MVCFIFGVYLGWYLGLFIVCWLRCIVNSVGSYIRFVVGVVVLLVGFAVLPFVVCLFYGWFVREFILWLVMVRLL